MTAAEIVAEPLVNFGLGDAAERGGRVAQLLDQVGLPQGFFDRLPHDMSGGQRQRLGIARALAASPSLIVADEAVAALDVSIRSQILNLLNDVQKETAVAYLFISHDLSVVRYLADEIAVMYLGAIVERAAASRLCAAHPYTRALLFRTGDASGLAPPRAMLEGEAQHTALPSGCRFRTRCPIATDLAAARTAGRRGRSWPFRRLPSRRAQHPQLTTGRNYNCIDRNDFWRY